MTRAPCTGKGCKRVAVVFGQFGGGLCIPHAFDLVREFGDTCGIPKDDLAVIQQAMDGPRYHDWKLSPEKAELDFFTSAMNPAAFAEGFKPYNLACGHMQVAKGWKTRMRCDWCQQIWDCGLDYHGFRTLGFNDPLSHVHQWFDDKRKQREEGEIK